MTVFGRKANLSTISTPLQCTAAAPCSAMIEQQLYSCCAMLNFMTVGGSNRSKP